MHNRFGQGITLGRIAAAGVRRIRDIPDAFAWRFSNAATQNRDRIAKMRDLHRGERCIILANGPSLAGMDLRPIKNEATIGMNRIYLNFERMGFSTSYYISINELVISQFWGEIAALGMTKFINWNQRGIAGKQVHDTCFLRTKLSISDSFSIDLTKPISSGGTVTFAALQLAYFLGFTTVILVGLDHRFADHGTPNRIEVRKELDQNHFDPKYFPPGTKWQLPDLHRSELAYRLARIAFETDGREISDATVNGACPVFHKADFQSLFGK